MRTLLLALTFALSALRLAAQERASVVVVVGAPGEDEYAESFTQQALTWGKLCQQAGARCTVIGTSLPGAQSDREELKATIASEVKAGGGELWIVLVGHGTFDGREAKFNLRGPDFTAAEMTEWLKPFTRPLAVVDTASASAPFLAKLAAPGRVIVSSTRSGNEQNYARFGKYFAEAIGDLKSDLDKDGQVSLLEAFLGAAQRTNEFYKTEGRLATEHALIDDNGDGLGTPAEWFRGIRATKQAKDGATLDGARAHQFHLVRSPVERQLSPEVRARRDALELKIARLRENKAKMETAKYYTELEQLLLELAVVYEGT